RCCSNSPLPSSLTARRLPKQAGRPAWRKSSRPFTTASEGAGPAPSRAYVMLLSEAHLKKLSLLILAFSLAAFSQEGRPNFSGNWELQIDKSDFGPLPAPQSQTMAVDHKDPKIKLSVMAKTPQGDRSSERLLTTDGQENTNQVGGSEWKSNTRWAEKLLVSDNSFEFQGGKVKMSEKWGLSEDGKTLTMNRAFKSDLGEAEQKLVYARKWACVLQGCPKAGRGAGRAGCSLGGRPTTSAIIRAERTPIMPYLYVLAAIALRLAPHPWNVTPLGAMFLFSGATFRSR